jgi:hypothetical protein
VKDAASQLPPFLQEILQELRESNGGIQSAATREFIEGMTLSVFVMLDEVMREKGVTFSR